MSKTIHNKISIRNLQDTYYDIVLEQGLFSDKLDHCFYIKGQYKGLGTYSEKSSKFYKSFVSLLNSYIYINASNLKTEMRKSEAVNVLKMIDGLELSEIWNESFGSGLAFAEGYYTGSYRIGGDKIKRIGVSKTGYSIKAGTKEYLGSFKDNTYYYLKFYICIYYLVNMNSKINWLCIKNDLSCIDSAVTKGWIKP